MKFLFIKISKVTLSFFFPRQYLRGEWFNKSTAGWKWCWRSLLFQKILRFNSEIPWPVSPFIMISEAEKLIFHKDDLINFQSPGCYYQNFNGEIHIGKGTRIAPNVGMITSNHNLENLDKHSKGKDIYIGKNCWIGMNSVILPGVKLGDNTIVGAGSIVTKSFENGNCIIVGNPAKIIKKQNVKG